MNRKQFALFLQQSAMTFFRLSMNMLTVFIEFRIDFVFCLAPIGIYCFENYIIHQHLPITVSIPDKRRFDSFWLDYKSRCRSRVFFLLFMQFFVNAFVLRFGFACKFSIESCCLFGFMQIRILSIHIYIM